MNDVRKNIIKCVAVLAIIAGISGMLLGFFNQITYVSPEEMISRELNKFFSADSFEKLEETEDGSIYQATKGGETFLVATANGEGGYSGEVPIYAKIVDGKISEVVAGTNQETIKAPFGEGYISNFINIDIANAKEFSLSAEGGKEKIDGVSGATKSSHAIMDGVNKCMRVYNALGLEEK